MVVTAPLLAPPGPGYEVSDCGRVRSVQRVILRGNGVPQTVRERILKPRSDGEDRPNVHIGGQNRRVGSIVLEAFVGARPNGMECCHADDDPWNNHLANLRWGTHSDNAHDRVRNGRHHMARRTECGYGHPLAVPNLASDPDRRRCLSCRRARTRGRRLTARGVTVDHQQLADAYYAELTRSVA